MGRKRQDPNEQAREEIEEAKKAGKTELSIYAGNEENVLLACELTQLKDLRLSGELKALPPQIGNLVNLKYLHVESNKLTTLPKEIGKLVNVTYFTCYSNEIDKLPDEVGDMESLEKWIIWSNKLKRLPKGIGRLKKLKEFEMQRNEIVEMPDEMNDLVSLETIEIESNELKSLPANLSGMAKLKEIKIGRNKFKTFPMGLCTLPAIERIELQENEITEVPDEIGKLTKLRELVLNKNKIKKLPAAVYSLPSLSNLVVKSNQITEIPVAIGGLKKLMGVNFDDNPITNIPMDVVTQGKAAIFEHLGITKARLANDTVDPDAVKARKEAIDAFVRGTKRKLTDEKMRDQLVAFFTGKSAKVPPARLKDHYSFGHISEALRPYAQWDFIDRRIVQFITQEAWDFKQPGHDYDTGYHEEFLRWVSSQMEEETDETLFGNVARELEAAGLDHDDLARRALLEIKDKLLHEDGRCSSFGRWVIDTVDPAVMKEAADRTVVKENLVKLLSKYAPPVFEKVADTLLSLAPDEDGEVHLPDEGFEALCKQDPARWDGLIQEALGVIGDCMPCRANAVRILGNCYPNRKDQARELATKLLADVSERKNKEDRFKLMWSPDGWDDATPNFIGWMLDTFGDVVRPNVLSYATETKVFDIDVAEVVAKKLGQDGIDIVAEGLKMTIEDDDIAPHFRRMFALLAPLDWSKYYDLAWELAQSEYKQVRQTACLALGKLPAKDVLPKAKELLSAKKSHQREGGAMILGLLNDPGTKAPLAEILTSEKSDDVRDVVVAAAFRKQTKIDKAEAGKRVASAKARGKLASPVAKWLDEKKLPAPSWAGGKAVPGRQAKVDADTLRFLFQRQTRIGEIAPDPEARDIYPLIERSDAFGEKLLALVMKNGGASAKTRFALTLIGMLSGDSVIEELEAVAKDKTNVNAVETIALLGSMEAARALDRIARHFRTKYPNVRDAAQDGFAAIADSMDMTPFELADAMLPDFGFKDHSRPMKVGKRTLEITLGADIKVALVENGTVLKSPPKDISAKQKTELKDLGAEVKEAARQLRTSLEYYLIVQRRWKVADWKAFFTQHPLATAFAKRLVWGMYDGNKRTQMFHLSDERAPVDVDGNKVTLAGTIGLVHPFDMKQAERDAWLAVLPEQPLVQLARPVFVPATDELAKTLSFSFEGKTVNSGTFKSRAERLGWRRGSVCDGGSISAYRKMYPTDQIEVFVRVDGIGVGMDYESEATLQDFFFVKQGSVVTGSYTYDEPRDDDDPRLLKLGDIPAIVLSETFNDLGAIVKQRAEAD